MKRIHLACSAVAVLALVGCEKRLDNDQAEKAIGDHFSKNYKVSAVKCPGSIKLKKDVKFDCAITFAGSDTVNVAATINAVESDGGHFDFKISDPIFDPLPMAAYLVSELKTKNNLDVTVDCGLVRKPKPEETCTVKGSKGETAVATVKCDPDGKPLSYVVKGDAAPGSADAAPGSDVAPGSDEPTRTGGSD